MTPELYTKQFKELALQAGQTRKRFHLTWDHKWPILNEDTPSTGFDRHYVYHTAWAARAVSRIAPQQHVDFSSSLYFASLVSAWVNVLFCDIRPPELELPGLQLRRETLTALNFENGSLNSVSCMHVLEHVGLGRYGDPLDYDGDIKAMAELSRVVKPGGDLLIAVPVGAVPVIQFNAHRIYRFTDIPDLFGEHFDIIEQALIPERGPAGLIASPSAEALGQTRYACGCYWLRKRT